MSRPRGEEAPDPGAVREARKARGMSQAQLAAVISERLPHRPISEDTISRIEQGVAVEPSSLWPVMLAVGLHEPPSRNRPRPGQPPGDWLRDLRESYGLAP